MPINIPIQSPALTIDKKLPPLTQEEAQLIGGSIVSVASLMSINLQSTLQNGKKQAFSPRLLNWVEPYKIGTDTWTLFYTEVNSNFVVGDRVFIVGGNYDSNDLIQINPYANGVDGYKVIFIDKCRVVLNIPYTGAQVYNQDPFDEYIRVYSPSTQEKFDYYSQMISGSDISADPTYGIYKFSYYHNNLIYSDNTFSGMGGFGNNTGIAGTGFFIRNGINYDDITIDFVNNNLSGYLSTNFPNNGKLWIVDGFTYNGQVFQEGMTYIYQNGSWVIEGLDFQPVIGKTNFRDGNFNSGKFNGGIYGQPNKQLRYNGDSVIWNTGTLLNSIWESGQMNTVFWGGDSYHAEFDVNGVPHQKLIEINNGGFGYTYVLNSQFLTSQIGHGNFFDSTFGTQSFTSSVIYDYLYNITPAWSKTLLLGYFESCFIQDCLVQESEIKYSRVYNSRLENSKSINSTLVNSLFLDNGVFTTNNLIQILGYQENSITIGNAQRLYKFYISDIDYHYFKSNDNFYLNGVDVQNQGILNYFDKRFIFNSYQDSDELFNPIVTMVQLSSSRDNQLLLSGSGPYSTSPNPVYRSSIDIYVENGPTIGTTNSDISNAWVWNSDFQSGIFDSSNWLNGNIINLNRDNHIYGDGVGNHIITVAGPASLKLTIGWDNQLPGYLNVGDPVYINGLNYTVGSNSYNLYSDYIITNIQDFVTFRFVYVQEINTPSIINGLPVGGKFNIQGVSASSNWVHRVKFNNSNIYSGLLQRTFVENSTFQPNGIFNSSDIDMLNMNNLKSLRLSDMLIANNGNTINSGLFYNSIVTSGSDVWKDGFFYNSYWNGSRLRWIDASTFLIKFRTHVPFYGGTFRESLWVDGHFDGGTFYKNMSNPTGSTVFDNTISEYYLTNNIKYSWVSGNFNDGDFVKSNWEAGNFNGGQMYNSNFFKGTMSGGIFGSGKVPYKNTQMYSGVVNGGVIENGYLLAQDPTYTYINSWGITFSDPGIFNNGVFGSDIYNPLTKATWKSGSFNGGQFVNYARWINGTFSGGKFISTYGWTMSDSTLATDYTWQNGKFTGGEFGNAGLTANSTWFKGEFSGGRFKGRVWNDGVMTSGEFDGSGTYSGTYSAATSPQSFLNSAYLTQTSGQFNYFGLWRDGFITDNKDKFIKDQKIWTTLQRNFTKKKIIPQVTFNNALWLTGTFSHPNGEIKNSIWLDGEFDYGLFYASSFNPYITRPTSGNFEVLGLTGFNQNDTTCYWNNGQLLDSTFYYSQWFNGTFQSGTAWGMIWLDGTADYMNANNIYWDGGLWRNGNWNGSPFNYLDINSSTYEVVPGFTSDIIKRIATYSSNYDLHMINAMTYSYIQDIFDFPGTGGFDISDPSWTFTSLGLINTVDTTYPPTATDFYIWLSPFRNVAQSTATQDYYSTSMSLSKTLAILSGTSSIFTDAGFKYDIQLTVGVATATSSIRFRIGNKITNGLNYIEKSNLESGNLNCPVSLHYVSGSFVPPWIIPYPNNNGYQVYTFNETYYPDDNDVLTLAGRQFEFWQQSGSGTVAILGLTIIKTRVKYYDTRFGLPASYNNQLVSGAYGIQLPINNPILIPPVQLTTVGSTGDFISFEFGNGTFRSGIWENGVWNNGWRQDDTISTFDTIYQAYKINPNTWKITLNSTGIGSGYQGSDLKGLQPGDKVSVGNLVAIDINENRRLITNYVQINNVVTQGTYNQVDFNIQTNFPIRRFEIDSNEHLIYMTKNVWLNGLFLNGAFNKGVWSNGLFQGFPYITEMFDTEWIDGTFNGGHFKGLTGTYYDANSNLKSYHTSLVQNFVFYDNNVATAFNFNYNSWIDVNYFTYSGVNLNKLNSVYKETPIGFTASYTENNLYGYPTMDVLSSVSTIRDGFSTASRQYNLGWRYKTYTNYDSPYDTFNDIVNSGGLPGVDNFINDGWTYSHNLHSPDTVYQSNLGSLTSNQLYVEGGNGVRNAPPTISDLSWFTLDSINNTYTNQIPKNRYVVIETEVQDNLGYGEVLLFYNNYPATYSIPYTPILFSDRLISAPVNMLQNPQPVNREYFFNKNSLDMQIFAGNTFSLSFDRISFIETDMIPFMQIMSDRIGQFRYLNWEEDYRTWGTPSNPGDIIEDNLWENVYDVVTTGTGSTNINSDVQDPYVGLAPKIDYSNPNFKYLSAVTIGIDTLKNSVT